jgi:hypothetical protein
MVLRSIAQSRALRKVLRGGHSGVQIADAPPAIRVSRSIAATARTYAWVPAVSFGLMPRRGLTNRTLFGFNFLTADQVSMCSAQAIASAAVACGMWIINAPARLAIESAISAAITNTRPKTAAVFVNQSGLFGACVRRGTIWTVETTVIMTAAAVTR